MAQGRSLLIYLRAAVDWGLVLMRIKLPDGRRRRLFVREAARLQSFPDWFEFQGTETSQFNQIGNPVPPLLAYHLRLPMSKRPRRRQRRRRRLISIAKCKNHVTTCMNLHSCQELVVPTQQLVNVHRRVLI